MTKKLTTAKLKAHLAMAAFVVVAVATITLTSVGVFDYATLNSGVLASASQASAHVAPFAVASALSNPATVQGN